MGIWVGAMSAPRIGDGTSELPMTEPPRNFWLWVERGLVNPLVTILRRRCPIAI